MLRIFDELKTGLRKVAARGVRAESVSVDSWGLDDMLHDHWMLVLGAVVVLVTLGLKQGLYGWLLEDKQ